MSEVEKQARELFKAMCVKAELEPSEDRWSRWKDRFLEKVQAEVDKEKGEETASAFCDELSALLERYNARIIDRLDEVTIRFNRPDGTFWYYPWS